MAETRSMGQCYDYVWAEAVTRGARRTRMRVAHGTLTHPWDGRRFEHAWIVRGGKVYDWQTQMRGQPPLTVAQFDKTWKPSRVTYYTPKSYFRMCVATGHKGPWHEGRRQPTHPAGGYAHYGCRCAGCR